MRPSVVPENLRFLRQRPYDVSRLCVCLFLAAKRWQPRLCVHPILHSISWRNNATTAFARRVRLPTTERW